MRIDTFIGITGAIIGILGTLFGILSSLTGNFATLSVDQKRYTVFISAIIILSGVIYFIIIENRERKRSRYAYALPKISKAISKFINNYKKDKFINIVGSLFNEVSSIYFELKQVKCCITLKIFKEDTIKTFARSQSFSARKVERHIEISINLLMHSLAQILI